MFNVEHRPTIHLFTLLTILALVGGCVGFKPANQEERIAYIQERLDTGLTGIESAYDAEVIDQATKNRALDDYWQPVKDFEAELVQEYVTNGGVVESKLDQATRKTKLMVAFLVAKGVLKDD